MRLLVIPGAEIDRAMQGASVDGKLAGVWLEREIGRAMQGAVLSGGRCMAALRD